MKIECMRVLMLATLLLASAPGAAHDERTRWEQGLELFVEPPLLVSGEPARLAVHLTTLADQRPLREGRVEVELLPRAGRGERGTSSAPAEPGIFIVGVTPGATGMHSLIFRIDLPDGMREIDAGRIPVVAPEVAARLRAEPGEDDHTHDEDIGFSKEAQWRMRFTVVPATEGPFSARLNLSATVEAAPGRLVDIVAPARGTVRPATDRSWLRQGQRVAAGEVLAELVPVAGIEDLTRLRADFEGAEARWRLANAELARVRGLVDDGALPQRRMIEAETEAVAARAARDTLRERLAAARGDAIEAEGLPLAAPLDGTVVASLVAPGQVVDAGARVAAVLDARRVWLRVQALAQDMASLTGPQDLRIRRPGSRDWHTPEDATLVYRGQVLEDGALPLIFEIANPGDLPVGLPLIASLATAAPETRVTVPEAAVLDDDGIDVVIVQTGGETFERRPVLLGPRAAGRVAVLDGLQPNERVVVAGGYAVLLAGRDPAGLDHGHTH